jgi:hypothetical protein
VETAVNRNARSKLTVPRVTYVVPADLEGYSLSNNAFFFNVLKRKVIPNLELFHLP